MKLIPESLKERFSPGPVSRTFRDAKRTYEAALKAFEKNRIKEVTDAANAFEEQHKAFRELGETARGMERGSTGIVEPQNLEEYRTTVGRVNPIGIGDWKEVMDAMRSHLKWMEGKVDDKSRLTANLKEARKRGWGNQREEAAKAIVYLDVQHQRKQRQVNLLRERRRRFSLHEL